MSVLALDIGGTKFAVGIVDAAGRVRRSSEVPTPQDAAAEVLWGALVAAIQDVTRDSEVTAVGVGCGGPMRWPEGEISPLNIPGWREFPLRARLEKLTGVEVVIHNDAVAFALGEHRFGAAKGWRDTLGIVVSTGVGGGLILDGEVRSGPTGNAGHFGHIVVDPDGPLCGCGGHGCIESIARGPATVRWAIEQGWQALSTGKKAAAQVTANNPPTGRDLAASATAGDQIAIAAFARAGRAVGRGIASAAALLDLEGVVVGGGMAGAGELLFAPIRAAVADHARLGFTRELPVVPAGWGREAGLIGAAALVSPA